jgi:SAM-dependent methyltransferase
MNNFDTYSLYYDLLNKDKGYEAEADYVSNLIQEYQPGAKTILEFGSGTGGHGLLLQQKGYKLFGLEQSASMAAIAQSRGMDCLVSDITDFQLGKQFDSVLAMFHVISYLNENEQLVRAFKNAHDHLKQGGAFLFDVWYGPAVFHQRPEVRKKEVEDDEIEVLRTARPVMHLNRNVVDVNYHIQVVEKRTSQVTEFSETHSMRYFSIPEIRLLAETTGFVLVKAEEFLTGNEPSENSWGVCFILKKL